MATFWHHVILGVNEGERERGFWVGLGKGRAMATVLLRGRIFLFLIGMEEAEIRCET